MYPGYRHWKKGEGHSQRLWMYRGAQIVCSDSGTCQQQQKIIMFKHAVIRQMCESTIE